MPEFEYKGKTLAGAQVSGTLKAKNQQDLERILRQNRILVTSVRKKAAELTIKFGTGVKKQDISRFTRQFATMIGSGLPMIQCLEILAAQVESVELRKIINKVKESVQGGATLADALSRHPKVFDVAVIGVPHDKWGEAVKAVVILKEGETATEEEIADFCKDKMAGYKKPKNVDFIKPEEMPRTSTMR